MPKRPIIKYTAKEFDTARQALQEYSQRFHPNVNTNRAISSFSSDLLDKIAYVSAQLHFLMDYNVNESFPDSAIEPDNLIRHGKTRGYKFSQAPSSFGFVEIYVTVPANSVGTQPDPNYIPVLKKGSELVSTSGTGFILAEDVDFARDENEVVVSAVDDNNGNPTFFAIKAKGQVISGEVREEFIKIGDYQKFRRVALSTQRITEVLSVSDAEGHEYLEVEYLTQDVVFKSVLNRDPATSNRATNILKAFPAPRRFVFEQDQILSYLQFGHGSDIDLDEATPVEPSNVVLELFGKDHITDRSFDPNKLISSDKLGIAPANTTLRVIYRVNTTDNVNAAPGSITRVTRPLFDFNDVVNLSTDLVNTVVNSIESDNETAITGDVSYPSSDELRIRIKDAYASQNRAVTKQDYITTVYRMPAKFGAIKRATIVQDPNSFKRNLNMYVISEDNYGRLEMANDVIKRNLKVWLSQYKMINDSLDILNARIVNFGINFTLVGERGVPKDGLRAAGISVLRNLFKVKMEPGEPLDISSIYKRLNKIPGVVDTVDVEIVQKKGGLYSDTRFDIRASTSADGRSIVVPADIVMELKFNREDIKGTVR